jgi:hypothetical protein
MPSASVGQFAVQPAARAPGRGLVHGDDLGTQPGGTVATLCLG